MAIYSFKNDRARDVLFELAMQSDQRRDPLADGAAYYLSLFPNSGELLPEIEGRLKEEIATARRELPDLSKAMFQENGDVVDQTEFREHVRRYDSFQKIGRLLALKNSLEYNEKIPADERERFDAFRREVAMSWSASNKRQRALPHWGALLKKGDEHFEIYLMEYPLPGLGVPVFRLENDGDSYPYTLTNPYWQKRKAFYERELADPRPLYTEAQIQYMERKLADIRAMER